MAKKNEEGIANPAESVAAVQEVVEKPIEPAAQTNVSEAPTVKPKPEATQDQTGQEKAQKEKIREGVNLSGGIRGWLSRLGASSRRES